MNFSADEIYRKNADCWRGKEFVKNKGVLTKGWCQKNVAKWMVTCDDYCFKSKNTCAELRAAREDGGDKIGVNSFGRRDCLDKV